MSTTSESAVSATARGASFMILVQVVSRATTFFANQILLRYLSPALLGAATQLELYCISVLFFARESLRVALQRQTSNARAVVNISYIPIALGLPLAWSLGALYLRSAAARAASGEIGAGLRLNEAVQLYGLAALVELLSEPCFVVMQMKLLYKVRAAAETAATIIRCAVTFGIVVWASRQGFEVGVLPFACGQLAYASVLLMVYLFNSIAVARKDKFSLTPASLVSSMSSKQSAESTLLNLFPTSILHLGMNLYFQSAIKYVLTQGDSLLISNLTTLSVQGSYALASNYGGLIARMLFQPLEDTSRNLFAKLCAPASASASASSSTSTSTSPSSKKDSTTAPSPTNLRQAATTLTLLLHLYSLLTLAAWSLGPPLAPHLLTLIAGRRWLDTGAGAVLSTYAYYIPLLAINGVTEAFVAATASAAELRQQSVLMTVWFVAFAGVAYVTLAVWKMGVQGLVWANCVNMACRIVYNVVFIRRFFGGYGARWQVGTAMPKVGSVAASVGVGAVLRARMDDGESVLGELIRATAVGVVWVAIVAVSERALVLRVIGMVKGLGVKDERAKKAGARDEKAREEKQESQAEEKKDL